ncbi:MAG: hypothetical protein IRZ09_11025 [Variibacter sp.]|nr:hypothetical protein [Variibacter sp.]
MIPSVLGLWNARRGRKAAVAAIAPLVERSRNRLNGIADGVWFDPYMIGFLVMLITLVAHRKARVLDNHSLGIVQSEAWAAITGLKPELIGEEVVHLSAMGDGDFEIGCRNAIAFSQALDKMPMRGDDDPRELELFSLGPGGIEPADFAESASVVALWSHYFDAHVTELPAGPAPA